MSLARLTNLHCSKSRPTSAFCVSYPALGQIFALIYSVSAQQESRPGYLQEVLQEKIPKPPPESHQTRGPPRTSAQLRKRIASKSDWTMRFWICFSRQVVVFSASSLGSTLDSWTQWTSIFAETAADDVGPWIRHLTRARLKCNILEALFEHLQAVLQIFLDQFDSD